MLDFNRIHDQLLKMAVETTQILEKNNIKYMITFGTLLGSIRHHGFIPWDCDFDLILFSDQYDLAKDILRNNLPDDMVLQDERNEPKYFHAWAHVKDKNSKAYSRNFARDNIYINNGLSVDLYIATRIKKRDINLFALNEDLKYRERLRKKGLLNEQEFSTIQKKILDQISIEKEMLEKKEENGYLYALPLPPKYRIILEEETFPLKQYQFQSAMFWGPNNADGILTRVYGDYMNLPPEEERIPNYIKVDFFN